MEKVLGFIARGRAQGARLVTGGARVTSGDLAQRLLRRAHGVRRLSR